MSTSHNIRLQVSATDFAEIQAKIQELGMTQTDFLINSALQRKLPLPKTDLDSYSQIALLTTELNRINLHLQKITKAIRQNSEPTVVVERELLLENQKLVQDAIALTKDLMHQLVH